MQVDSIISILHCKIGVGINGGVGKMKVYQNYGPFEIPRTNSNVSLSHVVQFFTQLERIEPGLKNARGCYVFAMRAGKGIRPWYVGKATGNSGFEQEALHSDKLAKYNTVIARYRKGTPVLFFLARRTGNDTRFSASTYESDAKWLERYLLGFAWEANPNLVNNRDTGMLREGSVPGLLNSSKRGLTDTDRQLKRAFNLLPTIPNKTTVRETIEELSLVRQELDEEIAEMVDEAEPVVEAIIQNAETVSTTVPSKIQKTMRVGLVVVAVSGVLMFLGAGAWYAWRSGILAGLIK
jgi:hypothetical protein